MKDTDSQSGGSYVNSKGEIVYTKDGVPVFVREWDGMEYVLRPVWSAETP